MKWILLCFVGIVFLNVCGCRCGCLDSSSSQDSGTETMYHKQQDESYPKVSSEVDFRAGVGKSF